MDKKEQMIMSDGYFATMMQQQEEDEDQILMEKEQQAMLSTPTGKALLVIQRIISLHQSLHSSIPQNLGVTSKVTNLAADSIFLFVDRSLRLQAVFKVAGKCHFESRVALHKLVIARDGLHR